MTTPKFIELKAHEEVLEVIRASLVTRVLKFFLLVVWLALPFFFLFPLWREGRWGIIVFLVWVLFGAILILRAYLIWFRTAFIITDQRVVDHDQQGFFHRVVTEARYDQIEEVSYSISGPWATIFRYGTLSLQLKGSSADIVIDRVNRPSRFANLINDLRNETNTSRTSNESI
jgi:hypothetical protein